MNKKEQRLIIAENLKLLLKQNNKKRTDLSSDLNVAYSTVGDWVRGRTAPSAGQVKMLADYFKVTIGDITTRSEDYDSRSDSEILDSKVRVPILVKSHASNDDSTLIYSTTMEYIDKYLPGSNDCIGFKLSDDSMEPEYHKGDIIIARRINYLRTPGDYVFVISEDDDWIPEYRLARVIPKGNDNIIYPLNVDNECKYVTEILNEIEYKKKYKAIYSIIRLIRDYK